MLDGFLALPQFAELDGMFLVGQDAVVIGSVVSPSQPVNYASGGGPVPLPYSPAGRVNPGGPMIPAPTDRAADPCYPLAAVPRPPM